MYNKALMLSCQRNKNLTDKIMYTWQFQNIFDYNENCIYSVLVVTVAHILRKVILNRTMLSIRFFKVN